MENKIRKILKAIKMKCNKCGYEWNTLSDKMFVSCPNCLLKVKKEEK
jgi:predicted Zn-ribbon and HTH transcriptional regulator